MKLSNKFGLTAKLVLAVILGVFLGISPLTSFGEASESTALLGLQYCSHTIAGDSGLSTFCQLDRCAHATGAGSNVAPCGNIDPGPGMGG